jgi:NADH-quinone oxidoreductase subunit J
MVLFLYVLMLMDIRKESEPAKNKWMKLAGTIAGGSLLVVLIAALRGADARVAQVNEGNIGLIENLGKVLFTEYVVPFEIASILFLSAMVGAVVIGKRDKEQRVVQKSVVPTSTPETEAVSV